jgi:PAP2 superfamily
LQRTLLGIVAAIVTVDATWLGIRHFDVDKQAYEILALLAAALIAGAMFYARVRKDESLSAMLFSASFLIVFSAAFSLLNYLLLTVCGPRIDHMLAAVDRFAGIDWPAMMAFIASYPRLNALLQLCYESVMPQIALLIIMLGVTGRPGRIYELSLSIGVGAILTVALWTIAPSFGAFSVYSLPPQVSAHLNVALDQAYARDLVNLLAQGPGQISPTDAKGLVGFPSFHGALAMMVAWYARDIRYLRWPILGLNALVLVATPIQGGHHVVDLVGGLAVALAAVSATWWLAARPAYPSAVLVRRPELQSKVISP